MNACRIFIFIFFFIILNVSNSVGAKEYWLQPPAKLATSCTKTSCTCTKRAACHLNSLLLQLLRPGDVVNFNKGTYPAFKLSNIHGSTQHPITFIGSAVQGATEVSLNPYQQRDLIEIQASSHITLSDFSVKNSPRAAIRINNSHYIAVENNILTNNGVWGVFTNHSNHFAAINNTIVGPAKQHGIYHSNSGDNVKIIANTIRGFNGCGIHFNGDLSMGGATRVQGDGIIANVVIANNYLRDNGVKGGSAINLDGVVNAKISNNIMINNKAAALSIFKDDGAVGSARIHANNNLIIMPKKSRWAINVKNSGGENSFTNNIIITQHRFRGIYDVLPIDINSKDKPSRLPFSADNNIYSYQRNLIALNNINYLPLESWQQHYNQDTRSVKLTFDTLFTANKKLNQPLAELVKARKTSASNPYLPLIM